MREPLFELLNSFLQQTDSDWLSIQKEMELEQKRLIGRDLLISQAALRLGSAFEESRQEKNDSMSDVVALLRQLIRIGSPVTLPTHVWQRIRERAELCRLVGTPIDGDNVEVVALPWKSDWLTHSEKIDHIEARREQDDFPGDGMVYAMSQAANLSWTTYRSAAQKAAVDNWIFAAPGSTTLVTLPTGGGKSLCTLLPPWYETRGGKRIHGTTLVVVPTVALALDQEKQAERFFQKAHGDFSKPISRTGDTSTEDRQAIESALRDGRLPILYTSPESLLGTRLYDVCLKAASQGLISRFVIDEAHLVQSWGAGFRPEFQLLGAYRKRLLQASNGKLCTLLLSATIGEKSRDTLETLFSEKGKLIVVQANRLRPEIGYWLHLSNSDKMRRQRVLEALRFLPRPLILYVTRPDQARQWEEDLYDDGYRRLASFSGETDALTRHRLIREWDQNKIDIMVATSAFGLGVDKSDVRAVVHATLPENIDRFYQEVGRGGRDGYSSVSLLCAAHDSHEDKDDMRLAYSLMPKHITNDKALPRWLGMIESSSSEGDLRWVDRDSVPAGQPDMGRNERNREWNDHLLLMMQRSGLIELIDAPPPQQINDGGFLNRILIRVLDLDIFNDPEQALLKLEPYRDKEKKQAEDAVKGIIRLVDNYAKGQADECLSSRFAALYEDVQCACGSCPACRQADEPPYSDPLAFSVKYPLELQRTVKDDLGLDPDYVRLLKLGTWKSLNVRWNGSRTMHTMLSYLELIPELVNIGFRQVIYPVELLDDPEIRKTFVKALAQPNPQRPAHFHRLVPDKWLLEQAYPLLPLGTVVLYPPEDRRADRLFICIERAITQGIRFPGMINIVHEGLYLKSAGKQFLEHVDGLSESLEQVLEILKQKQQVPEFF